MVYRVKGLSSIPHSCTVRTLFEEDTCTDCPHMTCVCTCTASVHIVSGRLASLSYQILVAFEAFPIENIS